MKNREKAKLTFKVKMNHKEIFKQLKNKAYKIVKIRKLKTQNRPNKKINKHLN